MSEFIVLGIIPGTGLQITFVLWLLVVVALAAFVAVRIVHRRHVLRNAIVTLYVLIVSRKTPTNEQLWSTL